MCEVFPHIGESIDDIAVTVSYDTVRAVVKVTSAANEADSITFTESL